MQLPDAITAPRFHHQWLPDAIQYGPRAIQEETAIKLKAMGHHLEARRAYGEVNAIARDQIFGGWIGGADYRIASHAAAY